MKKFYTIRFYDADDDTAPTVYYKAPAAARFILSALPADSDLRNDYWFRDAGRLADFLRDTDPDTYFDADTMCVGVWEYDAPFIP